MDNPKYQALISDALAMLDGESYPEVYAFIANFLNLDGDSRIAPMDFVEGLKDIPNLPELAWELILDILKMEIDVGNPDAMNDLGAMYYGGTGCEQSYEKAVYYYKMAAAHGSRQAQENLGYCYYYGRDVVIDYEKAFQYFALGAFDGHLVSLYKIGDMYANGYYVEKNEIEAFRIYEQCLQMMTDEAAPYVAGPVYLRLGDMFLFGRGTDTNVKTALICYQKAEIFLYDMVKRGDAMYKKSLRSAIEGQANARKVLEHELLGDDAVEDALNAGEYLCPNCNAILNKQKGFNPNLDAWTCTKCGTHLFDPSIVGEEYEDVTWYCDECGDLLNKQLGFTDTKDEWKCTKCGHVEKFDTVLDIRFDPSLLDDVDEEELS